MSWLSSVLGMDASHNAGVAQNAANKVNTQLTQIGTQNAGAYNQIPGAVANLQNGVNNNPLETLFQSGYTNSPLVQAFMQAYGLNGQGQAAGAPRPLPGVAGGAPGGAPGAAPTGQSILGADQYGLSQPQQIQLNTQLQQLDKAQQTAIANYKQSFSQRGGGDPGAMAAGVAAIEEQFAQLHEQTKGAFASNANTERQQGLQTLLTGGQGAQSQVNAANLSVVDLLQSLGNSGANQLAGVAGQNQQNANLQQQNATSAQSGILNLAGTLAGIYA